MIARVNLLSTDIHIRQIKSDSAHVKSIGGYWHQLLLEFEFEVHEYLKGDGGSVIWGVVLAGLGFDSEQIARDAAKEYWAVRDKYMYAHLDNREAIIMMSDEYSDELTWRPNTYYLGGMQLFEEGLGREFFHSQPIS